MNQVFPGPDPKFVRIERRDDPARGITLTTGGATDFINAHPLPGTYRLRPVPHPANVAVDLDVLSEITGIPVTFLEAFS
jgi:hypothetical protein